MAKSIKEDGAKTRAGRNGYDPARLKTIVGTIEGHYEELETERMNYMRACKPIHEAIADVYTEAKDAWAIPKKELKKVVKARQLERKAEKIRDDLEAEEQETFDQIRMALGDLADTPLGAGPLAKAAQKAAEKEDDRDLRPRHMKGAVGEDEAARIAAENKRLIEEGIKPLNGGDHPPAA